MIMLGVVALVLLAIYHSLGFEKKRKSKYDHS